MDIQQLQYFNMLASVENMTKAAEALGISQSALSKNIAKLEQELGYPLFDRNGKNIKLNHSGMMFLDYSKDIITILEEGAKSGFEATYGKSSAVKIAIIGECAKIVKCIKSYLSINPDAVFVVDEAKYGKTIPDINKYDIIVCPESYRYDVLFGSHLYDEELFLAVNKNHPLAEKIGVKSDELNNLQMVMVKNDNYLESTSWDIRLMEKNFLKVFYVNSRDIHVNFISEGIACGIIPEGAKPYYEDCKSIVVLPIIDKKFKISKKAAFKRANHLSEYAKNFIEFFKKYFGQI